MGNSKKLTVLYKTYFLMPFIKRKYIQGNPSWCSRR